MKISSICKICSATANYNFKHSGQNESFNEMIGGAEKYMPLCRECFNEKSRVAKSIESKLKEKTCEVLDSVSPAATKPFTINDGDIKSVNSEE